MNNLKKSLFITMFLFSIFSFWFAATWTNQTWSDSIFSWDLDKYSDSLKNGLISQIDSGYDKLYNEFQKTWVNIMKTIDYQSLVCLGVLSSESGMFLSMQNDKQTLKKEILKAFADIEIEIATLEEKEGILEKNWVNLFDSANWYEYEKKLLKKEIDNLVKQQKDKISDYLDNYSDKVRSFTKDFASYKSGNKELIAWISDKIFKIKDLIESYSWLETKISKLNNLLFSSSTFETAIKNLKKVAISNYEKKIMKLIDKQVSRYKKLPSLESALEDEKQKSLDAYALTFDESLSKVFSKFYRYDRYLSVLESIDDIEDTYYMKWKLNCKNILTSNSNLSSKINLLNKDITSVLASVESWSKLAQSSGYSKKFRTDIVSSITNFYKTPSTNAYKNFEKTVSLKIRELTSNITSWSSQELPSEDVVVWEEDGITWIVPGFSFKNPFKNNEKNEDIKILQELLIRLSYYSWAVNGIYDNATLNAVYLFQKNNWLLKWYENKPSVRWRMWPATRALLNNYLNK